jgi:hypothetical protein
VAKRANLLSRRKVALIGVGLAAAIAGLAVAMRFPSSGSGSSDRFAMIAPLLMIAAAVMVAVQRRRSEEENDG